MAEMARPSKETNQVSVNQASDDGDGVIVPASEWVELDEDVRAGFTTNDQRDMQRMGKKQQFRRNFRILTAIGFTSCVMGTWEILLTSNTLALIAGGMPGLFWSMTWAPTAGGQYHWVSEFAPRKYQKLLSYVSGWFSTICWQSIVAVDCQIIGGIIQGLISLNNPKHEPAPWQSTLLIWASAIGVGLFNVFGAKHLPLAEGVFVSCHVLLLIPVVVVLLVMAPKQSASAVFINFTDNGANWPNLGLTTMVGQVSAMFTVLGSDSVAHMSEEIENAGVIVPKTMIWSFFVNMPLTYLLLLTFLFCIGNLEEALSSSTGYPFIYAFENATGSVQATTGLTFLVLLLLVFITISSMASASRQTFAFARDNGLPFANWMGHVHESLHIPVNAVILAVLYAMALSLINIGSSTAFNAILSLSTVALMATYILSIAFCSTGGYLDHQGYDISPVQALIPGLQQLLAAFRKAKFSIYHTREGHRADLSTVSPRESFRSRNNASGLGIGSAGPLGRLLIRGEAGHDIIPELYPIAGEPVIDKPGRGAFTHTEFDLMLRIRGITNLVVAGVTTDCCVSSTIREASDRGIDFA
ncbi:hypothetical protein DV735_g4868, partial [Chaetothyriales sp. CBS 134920]